MKKQIISALTALTFLLVPLTTTAASHTYLAAYDNPVSWGASYNVTVTDNKITKASNVKAHAVTGKIITYNLIKNSSKKVTLTIVRQVFDIKYKITMVSTLQAGKLHTITN